MLDAPAAPTRRSIFLEFMAKVARLEELSDGGRRFLVRFQQELEYIRSPRVPSGSDVMSEIVRSNFSHRMESYLEAGCSLHCPSISNLNQLHSCEGELEDHINKVNVLLKELQCLVEDAYDGTLTANLSAIEVSGTATIGNKMSSESFVMEEKEQQLGHQLDSDSSLVTMMILLHNMLKLDYTMQEKIVRTLSLKSSSPELEGYCLMWELRPYVDDGLMNLAWKMC